MSHRIYFDNAATTPVDPEVYDAMRPVLQSHFGNPSSIHSFGREARALIEKSRKTVAVHLGVSPAELFFTSGGTEANNMALYCSVRDLGIRHIISSPIEHHAVLHTLEAMEKQQMATVHMVRLLPNGHVDFTHLEELLMAYPGSLVSLMHANNEIGNLLPIKKTGELCAKYKALFHSDTVQTVGHYQVTPAQFNAQFITCSAHKFHGPKGIGFLYIHNNIKIKPLLYGGGQERNMRGGTENIYGIVGLATALDIACRNMEMHQQDIQALKTYMISELRKHIPGVAFNGDAESSSLYTVLNVSFPPSEVAEMLLFRLDIEGIAASGGSACSSGSDAGSHVLKALHKDPTRPAVRFSFSKYNTKEEVNNCVKKLKEILCK